MEEEREGAVPEQEALPGTCGIPRRGGRGPAEWEPLTELIRPATGDPFERGKLLQLQHVHSSARKLGLGGTLFQGGAGIRRSSLIKQIAICSCLGLLAWGHHWATLTFPFSQTERWERGGKAGAQNFK